MHPIGRMLVVVIATAMLAPAARADDCSRLERQIKPYEGQLKAAMQDEAEDLPKELNRFAKALASGDAARAERIEGKIRTGYVNLQMIQPPSGLKKLHVDMIEYYRAGVSVLDAQSGGDEATRRSAEVQTWVGLRAYYRNIRDFFDAHGCNEGDVEAIDQRYLPVLDEQIEKLRNGEPAPDNY